MTGVNRGHQDLQNEYNLLSISDEYQAFFYSVETTISYLNWRPTIITQKSLQKVMQYFYQTHKALKWLPSLCRACHDSSFGVSHVLLWWTESTGCNSEDCFSSPQLSLCQIVTKKTCGKLETVPIYHLMHGNGHYQVVQQEKIFPMIYIHMLAFSCKK